MPPQLTDAWASAYLQILVGVLVFALGLPAFILQLVLNKDLVRVTERRIKTTGWLFSVLLLGIASVAFIWWIHPPSVDGGSPEWMRWTASLTVTLAPIAAAWLGYRFLRRFRRDRVIDHLRKSLEHYYEKHGSLESSLLRDLIFLGQRGKPGDEKRLVLNACAELAQAIQGHQRYKGEELTELIRSLGDILDNTDKPGDGRNYAETATLLSDILIAHSNPSRIDLHLLDSYDARTARWTFREICLASIKAHRDVFVVRMLDAGASYGSDIVLQMGISSLRRGRFFIAIYALNRLETEVETESAKHGGVMEPGPATSMLLGLIAHFVAADGAARMRGQNFFERQRRSFFVDLETCLKDAFEYHYFGTDFETADNITALSLFLKKSNPAPEPLTPEPLT